MKRTRLINLIALLINLAIVGAFCAGIYFRFIEACIKDLSKFNELGKELVREFRKFPFFVASFNCIASLFMMFCNGVSAKRMKDSTPGFFFTLRYIAMGLSFLSILFMGSAFYLADGSEKMDLLFKIQNGNLFINTCVPLASIVLFLFFELEQKCKFRKNFWPLIVFTLYCGAGIALMIISDNLEDAAYISEYNPFLWITNNLIEQQGETARLNVVGTRSLFAVVLVLSFVLPCILWLINKVISSLIIGYEYVEIDAEGNVIRPIVKPQDVYGNEEKSTKVVVKHKTVHYDNVYHVSVYDRKLRSWKVVLPNKSTKVFNTQQEALTFASHSAFKSKGTVRVHTALGKLKFERQ